MASFPIIVVGASAGGVEGVSRLVGGLPPDLPAAVFVTMHFPSHSTSVLPRILSRVGSLPASHPKDGETIQMGRIYVATPDFHLVIGHDRIRLIRGPKEHGNRPAIDPTFRSAAASHGKRVIGVVLTGNLNDGTAGLLEVKRHGGIAIAQDPHDALFPSMPASAVEHVRVDHVRPLDQIPELIASLVQQLRTSSTTVASANAAPDDAQRETAIAHADAGVSEDAKHLPVPSQFGCPDCGGVLWEVQDGALTRFRCRVGHAWTGEGLAIKQGEQLDDTLWTALRTLEESVSLSKLMADKARNQGNDTRAARYERDARTVEEKAARLRDLLMTAHGEERPSAERPTVKIAGR